MRRSEIEVKNTSPGLFLNVPPIRIPVGGMTSCRNVRIRNGRVRNENMGWVQFTAAVLDGPVTGIMSFTTRTGAQSLVFGTGMNLYEYLEGTDTVRFLTPRYSVGTIDVLNGNATVTGNGTLWNTIPAGHLRKNVVAGDALFVGSSTADDPAGTWLEVGAVVSDTELTLVDPYAGADDTSLDYTILKHFSSLPNHIWTNDFFPAADGAAAGDDILIVTNGVDQPHYWNGSADTFLPMTTLAFTCRVVRVFKNIMLYGDITEGGIKYPSTVASSAVGDPFNVATLEATRLDWGDGISDLHVLEPLVDQMVAYGEHFVSIIQFVGTPVYFLIRRVDVVLGTLSRRTVVNMGHYHSFLDHDGGHRFDGNVITEYGNQVFHDAIRKIDPSRFYQAMAHIDRDNGDVLWVIPQNDDPVTGYPSTAYSEHYLESDQIYGSVSPFTVRDFPAMSSGYYNRKETLRFSDLPRPWSTYNFRWSDQFWQALFPFNLFGTRDGKIMIFGVADDADGDAISSWARFGRMRPGKYGMRQVVSRIEPYTIQREGYPLTVILWGADSADGPLQKKSQIEFDLDGSGNRFVSPRSSVRYGEVEFATNGANQPWDISGFRVELLDAGLR